MQIEWGKLLVILTVADIRAVGPGVWNGWKGQLLRDLYHATEAALRGGRTDDFSVRAQLAERAEMARQALSDRVGPTPQLAAIEGLLGDPSKPGFYMVYNKWTKGNHFSRPHFHPNDRYIVVLQGTWWVGSGPKFDTANTTPMPAGSFVTHFAKQVHWDGAKDEDTILLIMGEGPATSTGAEEK